MTESEIKFLPITQHDEIIELSDLAYEIWNEHFPSIISQEQIDYMLKNFQSPEAVFHQINDLYYKYYFINYNNHNVGYFAIENETSRLFLSKIYVKKEFRKKGIAKTVIKYIEKTGKENQSTIIWLTVNKNNRPSIETYKKWVLK